MKQAIDRCVESVKRNTAASKVETENPPCQYTLEEIEQILAKSEAELQSGKGIPDDEVWREI